jgi:hypothetical protein
MITRGKELRFYNKGELIKQNVLNVQLNNLQRLRKYLSSSSAGLLVCADKAQQTAPSEVNSSEYLQVIARY